MKTCNNCGTQNTLSAHRCITCRMAGNFTFREEPGASFEVDSVSSECTNCGHLHPGDGSKCVACNFPLPGRTKKKAGNLENTGTAENENRRNGESITKSEF